MLTAKTNLLNAGHEPQCGGVAQTFLSAVSPTFLSAGTLALRKRVELSHGLQAESLRYSRQECLRYDFGLAAPPMGARVLANSHQRLAGTLTPPNVLN